MGREFVVLQTMTSQPNGLISGSALRDDVLMNSTNPEAVRTDAAKWFEKHWDPELPLGRWWQLLADARWAFPSWPEGFG